MTPGAGQRSARNVVILILKKYFLVFWRMLNELHAPRDHKTHITRTKLEENITIYYIYCSVFSGCTPFPPIMLFFYIVIFIHWKRTRRTTVQNPQIWVDRSRHEEISPQIAMGVGFLKKQGIYSISCVDVYLSYYNTGLSEMVHSMREGERTHGTRTSSKVLVRHVTSEHTFCFLRQNHRTNVPYSFIHPNELKSSKRKVLNSIKRDEIKHEQTYQLYRIE